MVQEAGRLLLHTTPIEFGGNVLKLSEEQPEEGGLFVPRRAGPSRPKAGLGHVKSAAQQKKSGNGDKSTTFVKSQGEGRGQDDFRRMLNKS